MSETDRIVVVSNGFGAWTGGKHAASARWSDVVRVAAEWGPESPRSARPARLVVALRDGTVIALAASTAGWDAFLAAAATRLPGLAPKPAGDGGTAVLFERAPGGR